MSETCSPGALDQRLKDTPGESLLVIGSRYYGPP